MQSAWRSAITVLRMPSGESADITAKDLRYLEASSGHPGSYRGLPGEARECTGRDRVYVKGEVSL